jgi:hypothetical protein
MISGAQKEMAAIYDATPWTRKETAAIYIAAVRCVSDPELLSAMRQALPPVPRSGNCSLCELMF